MCQFPCTPRQHPASVKRPVATWVSGMLLNLGFILKTTNGHRQDQVIRPAYNILRHSFKQFTADAMYVQYLRGATTIYQTMLILFFRWGIALQAQKTWTLQTSVFDEVQIIIHSTSTWIKTMPKMLVYFCMHMYISTLVKKSALLIAFIHHIYNQYCHSCLHKVWKYHQLSAHHYSKCYIMSDTKIGMGKSYQNARNINTISAPGIFYS